ncbi:MAG: hypothetical protein ACO1O6_01795 [Bacteroidota bacterium]
MKLKITFLLKAGKQQELPIIALVSYGYKEFNVSKDKFEYLPLRYYTGLQVSPFDWDKNYGIPKIKELKEKVILIEKHIRECYQYLTHNLTGEFLNPKKLKEALDEKLKGKSRIDIKRIRLVDFILNEVMHEPLTKQSTKNRVKSLSNFIEDFETKSGRTLYANDLDDDTFRSLVECYRNREGVKKNNSVWSMVKQVSVILNKISRKYKVHIYNATLNLKGREKISRTDEEKIYFNMKQILKIIESEPETYKMRQVKLIIMTLIFTGVRYSDVFKVRNFKQYEDEDINFDYVELVTAKTNKAVVIPILKPLKQVFDQYGGPPLPMSRDSFNELVKEFIANLKFTVQVSLPFTNEKGERSFEARPFSEFVSSHIGRRSFISNLINHIPAPTLSKITTHEIKNESKLFLYNHKQVLENACIFVQTLKHMQETHRKHFIFDWV